MPAGKTVLLYNPKKKLAIRKKSRKTPVAKAQSLLTHTIPLGASAIVPRKRRLQMRYVDQVYLNGTAAAGGRVNYIFRANSIYDPDYTGTGHQPMGHDTYAALYNHYSVRRSAIRVTLQPTLNLNVPVVCGLNVDDSAALATDYRAICEQARSMKDYGVFTQTVGNLSGGQRIMLNAVYDRDAVFKYKGDLHAGTNASFGASPGEAQYFTIWGQNADGSATNWGGSIAVFVEIVFDVEVTEPIDQELN